MDFLRTFKTITEHLSGEKYITMSTILPILTNMENYILK